VPSNRPGFGPAQSRPSRRVQVERPTRILAGPGDSESTTGNVRVTVPCGCRRRAAAACPAAARARPPTGMARSRPRVHTPGRAGCGEHGPVARGGDRRAGDDSPAGTESVRVTGGREPVRPRRPGAGTRDSESGRAGVAPGPDLKSHGRVTIGSESESRSEPGTALRPVLASAAESAQNFKLPATAAQITGWARAHAPRPGLDAGCRPGPYMGAAARARWSQFQFTAAGTTGG
jgi:hypothetical protein